MTSSDSSSGPDESSGPGRQPLSRDDLLKIVRSAEDEIRRDSFETLLVFDRTGREILRKPGQRDNVQLTVAEYRHLRGRVVTHDHPHGWTFPPTDPRHEGHSFSLQDVSLAIGGAVAEMRVVTPVWRYSLRPGPGQRWTRRFFTRLVEPAFREADMDVRGDFMTAVYAGQMTLVQGMSRHYHEVWIRVAAQTGVHYERETA